MYFFSYYFVFNIKAVLLIRTLIGSTQADLNSKVYCIIRNTMSRKEKGLNDDLKAENKNPTNRFELSQTTKINSHASAI